MPNPLDPIELRAVGRQLQQSDIAGDYQALAPVPTSTIEDHSGMSLSGHLAHRALAPPGLALIITPKVTLMSRSRSNGRGMA
jgi:hypothetical protein